jgi:nucleotide-binding universal stress UspA family protein
MLRFSGPVLIAYDGSSAARHAIVAVADLLGARRACVVTVGEEALAMVPPDTGLAGAGAAFVPELTGELGRDAEERAHRISREGAALARSVSLDAEAVSRVQLGGVAETIVALSRERDASLVVIGSRGLGGPLRRLAGGTASRVLEDAPCPVLVVHEPAS